MLVIITVAVAFKDLAGMADVYARNDQSPGPHSPQTAALHHGNLVPAVTSTTSYMVGGGPAVSADAE